MKKLLLILFLGLTTIATKSQSIDTLCIKNATVYENITLGNATASFIPMSQVISEIKDPKIDFIFRAYWRWSYAPDSNSVAPNPWYAQTGHTYKQLTEAIQQIKDSIPDIIICGAIPSQKIDSIEINDLTGNILDTTQTWAMALDPQKWGIPITKDSIQNILSTMWYSSGIYPDITDSIFQQLIVDWAKKQINCGMDAIWIDLLYTQASIMETLTGDSYHISVQESYNAATSIINEIHNYGNSISKQIYVGTWSNPARRLPYPKPNLDFVTETVTSSEIINDSLDENYWIEKKDSIINTFGNIPILVFIDWGYNNSPLEIFSQHLTSLQQKEFIAEADTFFYNKNMTFTYPTFGGSMGDSAIWQSYGISQVYHSAAPEFLTYDTIQTLGITKSYLPWYCSNLTEIEELVPIADGSMNFLMYPNPSQQLFTVELPQQNFNVTVFDISGRIIFKQKNISNKIQIDSKEFTIGIYFVSVRIMTGKQTIDNQKLIIMK